MRSTCFTPFISKGLLGLGRNFMLSRACACVGVGKTKNEDEFHPRFLIKGEELYL